jgi:hypothetical protein
MVLYSEVYSSLLTREILTMTTLEEQFAQACNARDLPGVVLVASDAKGGIMRNLT